MSNKNYHFKQSNKINQNQFTSNTKQINFENPLKQQKANTIGPTQSSIFQPPSLHNKIFQNIPNNITHNNHNKNPSYNNSSIPIPANNLNNNINYFKAQAKPNHQLIGYPTQIVSPNSFGIESSAFAGTNTPNFNITKNKFLMNFNPPNLINQQDRVIAFGQDRSENNFKKTLRKPAISNLIQNNSLSILNPNPVLTNSSFSNSLRSGGAAAANQNSINSIDPNHIYHASPFTAALKSQGLPSSNYGSNALTGNYAANSETNSIHSTTTTSNSTKESGYGNSAQSALYIKDASSVKEFSYKEDPNYRYRGAMEDMSKCIDKYLNNADLGLFTLFDGHGGAEIAQYVKNRLPELFAKILSPLNNKFETEDLNYDIENCINILFSKLDDEIKLTSESEYMGSTAVMVLVCKEKDYISPLTSRKVIYCANVGDSRCVLVSNFGVKRMSYDHKASDIQEINRVNSSGGLIFNGRVFGQLIITRAFGDHSLKRYGVIATPHISKHFVSEKDKYLVLASDGVWDVIMDEELLKLSQTVLNADEFSKLIIKTALLRGTQDNISCIVIKL